jgi:hypothetical protein
MGHKILLISAKIAGDVFPKIELTNSYLENHVA